EPERGAAAVAALTAVLELHREIVETGAIDAPRDDPMSAAAVETGEKAMDAASPAHPSRLADQAAHEHKEAPASGETEPESDEKQDAAASVPPATTRTNPIIRPDVDL